MALAIPIHDIPVCKEVVQPVAYSFRSKSGGEYELRLGKDGVAYCTCPAWRFSGKNGKVRTCKHIQSLEQTMFVDPTFTPYDGMVL